MDVLVLPSLPVAETAGRAGGQESLDANFEKSRKVAHLLSCRFTRTKTIDVPHEQDLALLLLQTRKISQP